MLKIKDLTKFYGNNKVFDSVSLDIKRGTITALLGMNGAGKTTLQNIIMNRTNFTGNILIDNITNVEFIKIQRNNILYLPDTPFLYDFLTGIELVKFVADIQKIRFTEIQPKVDLLLDLFNLTEYKNGLINDYSRGMKHKIALISILIQSPKILLLDEPVAGLDTISIIALKKLLKSMANNGTTIIFSTHILDLVEGLCDSVAILHNKNLTFYKDITEMNKNEIEKIYLDIAGTQIDFAVSKLY